MSKEVIFHAETIEEAIEAGLKQLGVERSQVEIEIISEPKEHFGLPIKSATVKLTLIDDDENDGKFEAKAKPVDEGLWVENGELKYSPPQGEGNHPVLIFDELVTVIYNGNRCKNRLELDKGIDPLEIILPPPKEPKKELRIIVSSDQLQAYLRVNRIEGYRYYLVDQSPTKLLELKWAKETIPF